MTKSFRARWLTDLIFSCVLFPDCCIDCAESGPKASWSAEPLGKVNHSQSIGTLTEIFDGNPLFTPSGCLAQAWTVAEALGRWWCFSRNEGILVSKRPA